MNNLHRELAPVSETAWAQIEEEASTFKSAAIVGKATLTMV